MPERPESNTLDNQIRFVAGDRFSIPAIRGDKLLAMVFLFPFCFISRRYFHSQIKALARHLCSVCGSNGPRKVVEIRYPLAHRTLKRPCRIAGSTHIHLAETPVHARCETSHRLFLHRHRLHGKANSLRLTACDVPPLKPTRLEH